MKRSKSFNRTERKASQDPKGDVHNRENLKFCLTQDQQKKKKHDWCCLWSQKVVENFSISPPKQIVFRSEWENFSPLLVISIYSFLRSNATTHTDAYCRSVEAETKRNKRSFSPAKRVPRRKIYSSLSRGANRFLCFFVLWQWII